MRHASPIGWAALVVIAGALVWWTTRAGPEASPPPLDTHDRPDEPVEVTTPRLGPAAGNPEPAMPGPQAALGLRGRVVERWRHTAVEGALVHVHGEGSKHTTSSDVGGNFVLADLAPGRYQLVVFGGGWCSPDLADLRRGGLGVEVPPTGAAEIELTAVLAGSAMGRVLRAEGEAVAGAIVRPRYETDGLRFRSLLRDLAAPTAVTSADGTFVLDSLAPNVAQRLVAETQTTYAGLSERVRPRPGERVVIDVRLPPARWLAVQVLAAEAGDPLPGASAYARFLVPFTHRGALIDASTDAAGRCRVGPLPPGDLEVEVDAEGYVRHLDTLDAAEKNESSRIYRLERGLPIRGRVVGADDSPVVELWVTATQGDRFEEARAAPPTGAFHFTDLRPGPWTVQAHVNPDDVAVETVVEAGAEDVLLRIPAPAARALELWVLDPQGNPIPRFEVEVNAPGMTWYEDGEDGRLAIPAGQARRWIEIRRARSAKGALLPYAPIVLGPFDGSEERIVVRLEPGLSIEGTVLDEQGAGLEGIRIVADPIDRSILEVYYGIEGTHAATRTGADGHFVLIGLGTGRYRVLLTAPGRFVRPASRIVAAGTEGLDLRLASAAEAAPKVVDPQGRPVVEARVSVRQPGGGGYCTGKTDAKGIVRLLRLAPKSSYRLRVRPPSARLDLARLDTQDWSPSDTPVVLPRGWIVHGRVVDGDGKPVAGAEVHSFGPNLRDTVGVDTAKDGTFAIGHLPAGPLDLVAKRWEAMTERRSALQRVEAGADDVVLVIRPRRELVVRFSNPPPTLVGRAMVLRRQGTHMDDVVANAEANGTVKFGVDAGGLYDLHVGLEDLGMQAWREGIRGDVGKVEMTFSRAQEISGRVWVPPGAGRPYVKVDERGVDVRTLTAPDGTFELRGLPPGTWTVAAGAGGPDGSLRAEAKAMAGARADLHLR